MELCIGAFCILCTASAGTHARVNTTYYANGACTSDPTPGLVEVPPGGFNLPVGMHLKSYAGVTIHGGELRVHNSADVRITNVNSSKRLRVTGRTATGLRVSSFRVFDDEVAVSITGGGGTYDTVDMAGTVMDNVAGGRDAAVSLLHAVGHMSVQCVADSQVIVHHFRGIDADVTLSPSCNVVNLTDIFGAFGSAYMFDAYGKRDDDWLGSLEQFTWLLGAATAILFLAVR